MVRFDFKKTQFYTAYKKFTVNIKRQIKTERPQG